MPYQNPFMAQRQRNILAPRGGFGNPDAPTRSQPGFQFNFRQPPRPMDEIPRPDRPDSDQYFDEMNRIQNEGSPSLTAYKEALSHQPTREEHAPGVWKRLGTALAGGAIAYGGGDGYGMAKEVQDAPYKHAIEDYDRKLKGLGEQADIEQDATDSRLKMLQNARAMGLKYDQYELQKLEAQSRMTNATTTANAALKRAEAYAAQQAKPGYDTHAQEDGSVLYVNKNNPADRHVVPAKTVAAGQLGVARTNAGTAQRNARTAEGQLGVAQANASTSAARGAAYVDTVGKPRPAASRVPTPDVQQDAEDNALRQMATDPLFKGFIGADDKGFPTVTEDDGSEDYQDFLEALDAKVAEILSGKSRRARRR